MYLKKIMIFALAMLFAVSLIAADANAKNAKNVIFMVPDGMGLAYVTAARSFLNGPNGDPMLLEQFSHIGYQRTHSNNSLVTDSAAAAAAWASGEKYNNGEISCHDDDFDGACDGPQVPTILDIAKAHGKSTGLVATSDITHATPAAFGANVHNRKCEEEIASQFLDRKIDVLLGGGIAANRSSCKLDYSTGDWLDELLEDYEDAGYTFIDTETAMNTAVADGAEKLLGLFKPGGKTPETFWVDKDLYPYPEDEPTLAEMTEAALDILEENNKGFFLVIEGSQIDWAGHANDIDYLLGEMVGFDKAVEVVKNWMAANDSEDQTLVIVVADHETGGFAINGPYGTLSAPGDIVQPGWTSGGHTAVDTIIWSQGPGSKNLGGAVDNTDLYEIMKECIH
jgi:alkaline phosphatase